MNVEELTNDIKMLDPVYRETTSFIDAAKTIAKGPGEMLSNMVGDTFDDQLRALIDSVPME
jgi:hypothetical protein